jgi:hypothetical protein
MGLSTTPPDSRRRSFNEGREGREVRIARAIDLGEAVSVSLSFSTSCGVIG